LEVIPALLDTQFQLDYTGLPLVKRGSGVDVYDAMLRYVLTAVSPQGLYIDEMYFSYMDEAVDLTKYASGYLFNNEIMDCKNVVPTYGVDISDRMHEALQSFLSDEYDGEHASKFDICDLKQVGEVTYVVSFRRVIMIKETIYQ
jgi:hypothetical protein